MGDLDPLARLRDARGFVFDLDGTLVLGDPGGRGLRPLPGAVEITSWAAGRGLPFVVFTNGTTRTPARLAGIMREIGFGVAGEAVITPASSAVRVLGRQGHRRIMVLGGSGLTEPLRDGGFEVVPPTAGTAADAVLAGKPSLDALRSAADRLGVRPADLAVVGDDPQLEVPMAHRGRALAIAVGTGLGGPDAYDGLPAACRPHLQVRGVDELLEMLGGADGG